MVKHERYNEKVDVFSLGCLMHELFSRELRSAALLSKGPDAQLLQNYALRVRAACCCCRLTRLLDRPRPGCSAQLWCCSWRACIAACMLAHGSLPMHATG